MNEDIRPIVDDWPYRPGKVSVRKVVGEAGRPKIQMRLDLGLIQMEPTGRPDGKRPEGFESLLSYHQDRLEKFRRKHRTELGFELSPEECRKLREESLMYYHRYLSCFILEDYDQVIRDTQRNVELFDLCNRYAAKKADRMMLEQYRPYVIMMNTRAKAHRAMDNDEYARALTIIKAGLKAIKKIYVDIDQTEDFKLSMEATTLRQLGRRIRRKLPVDEETVLERKLRKAVSLEQFEEAARLRDRLERMKHNEENQQEDSGPK